MKMEKILSPSYMIRFGNGGITYYGFFIALGIVLGVVCGYFLAKRRGYPKDTVIDMAMWAVPLAVVFARLYYVVFDALGERNIRSFGEIFAVWNGGLAIYGAVLGAILGVYILSRLYRRNPFYHIGRGGRLPQHRYELSKAAEEEKKEKARSKPSFFQMADLGAPFLLLGQAIGRWGNYMNEELFGFEIKNPSWQWFPFAVENGGRWYAAAFFWESALNLIGVGLLLFFSFRKKQKFPGFIFALYMLYYGVVRFILEFVRFDDESTLWLIPGKLPVSMAVSIIFILWGGGIIAYRVLSGRYPEKTEALSNKIKRCKAKLFGRFKRDGSAAGADDAAADKIDGGAGAEDNNVGNGDITEKRRL